MLRSGASFDGADRVPWSSSPPVDRVLLDFGVTAINDKPKQTSRLCGTVSPNSSPKTNISDQATPGRGYPPQRGWDLEPIPDARLSLRRDHPGAVGIVRTRGMDAIDAPDAADHSPATSKARPSTARWPQQSGWRRAPACDGRWLRLRLRACRCASVAALVRCAALESRCARSALWLHLSG